jgi:hypothetical protein
VSELLHVDLGIWDIKKIEENFFPFDSLAISRIPIGKTYDDCWAWTEEKSGYFSVRSCYRILSRQVRENVLPSSSGEGTSLCWKKLWKLPIPPKVRGFWWRVINEFIPCRQILKKRHMEEIAHCKTCGAEEEPIFHALFECAWARQFWREVREVTKVKLSKLCPTSWATDLVEGKIADEETASIILCGCWSVWTERNSFFFFFAEERNFINFEPNYSQQQLLQQLPEGSPSARIQL